MRPARRISAPAGRARRTRPPAARRAGRPAGAPDPRLVVDLGCGPGPLTGVLADRWPVAHVEGIDSSPEMIAEASVLATDRLTFRIGDVAQWRPSAEVDVIVSNATLQWVPEHRDLMLAWAGALPVGGWLGVQ